MTKENNNKGLAIPSAVIQTIADNRGGKIEVEYRKENGTKPDGTVYESKSWIFRGQNDQKEIPVISTNSESRD